MTSATILARIASVVFLKQLSRLLAKIIAA